eukprot:SAG11_NODE_4952_length_1711_cov_3.070720_2_plen_109_part_00
MDAAAQRHGLPIQLCMTLPSDLMQSLEMQMVTNYRASGDYAGASNFDIGGSSLLAWALGLRPSKGERPASYRLLTRAQQSFFCGFEISLAHSLCAARDVQTISGRRDR